MTVTGNDTQFGVKIESVPGTPVVVDKFLPIVEDKMDYKPGRVMSDAIFAGERFRRLSQRNGGTIDASGSVGLELHNVGDDVLLRAIMGTVVTTGSGPYTHTYTAGPLPTFTAQKGVSRGDIVKAYTYAGCVVDSAQFAVETNQIATLGVDFIAMSMVNTTALASASYPSGILPWKFNHGFVTIDGTDVEASKFKLDIKNNLNGKRYKLGSKNVRQPKVMDTREVTGTATVEFSTDDLYDLSQSQETIVVEWALDNGGGDTLTFTMSAQIDPELPKANKRDIVEVDVPFFVGRDDTDASALTIVSVNGTSTV